MICSELRLLHKLYLCSGVFAFKEMFMELCVTAEKSYVKKGCIFDR